MNGYKNICITSGIGKNYYYKNKLGYHLDGMYMKKNIFSEYVIKYFIFIMFIYSIWRIKLLLNLWEE